MNKIIVGQEHTIQVGGIDITPGKTFVKTLEVGGFELSDTTEFGYGMEGFQNYRVYDTSCKVDGRTYYDNIRLVKNGKAYADLEITNTSYSKKPLEDCIVSLVKVTSGNVEGNGIMVDGVKFSDLSVEQLTKDNGKPSDSKELSEGDRYYTGASGSVLLTEWDKLSYNLSVYTYKDGKVNSIIASCRVR